eukprot:520881-Ditylum_brightwellii.AAC.1
MAAFESKLSTHFITYFEQQDAGTRLCGLHSLNNATNKRTFKEEMLWNVQQSTRRCVNYLVTDEMEVDEFEEDELGNYSFEEKGYGFNHFFALHRVPGDKWLLKDSLRMAPYMI